MVHENLVVEPRTFREQVEDLVEPMSTIAHDNFDGYVELDEVAGTSPPEFVLRLVNEADVCEATLDIKMGPLVEGRALIWGKPGDVDEWQLLPLIPRALMGVLAY